MVSKLGIFHINSVQARVGVLNRPRCSITATWCHLPASWRDLSRIRPGLIKGKIKEQKQSIHGRDEPIKNGRLHTSLKKKRKRRDKKQNKRKMYRE